MTRVDRPAVRAVAQARVRAGWRALVLIGLVAGLVGGLVVAALAGARRTSTAYDRSVARTDFPDAFVQLVEPRDGLAADIAMLPSVARAEPSVFVVGVLSGRSNQVLVPMQASAQPYADLPILDGRAPAPDAVGEVVISRGFADGIGIDVGSRFEHRALTDAEFAELLRNGGGRSPTGQSTTVEVVGIVQTPTDAVSAEFPTMTGTPAYFDQVQDRSTSSGGVWIHVAADADVADLERELAEIVGEGSEDRFNGIEVLDFTADRRAVDDAARVLVIGLLVAAAVAAAAGAVVVTQLVARWAEREGHDRRILRQLGFDDGSLVVASLAVAWPVAVVALVVSLLVAAAVSPAMPFGTVRSLEPSPGLELNLAFLAAGPASVVVSVLVLWWVGAARARRAASAAGARASRPVTAGGPVASVAAAVASDRGRRASRRTAFAVVLVGVGGAAGVAVFDASLQRMVETPERWGSAGDVAVEVPDPDRDRVYAALDRAPEVEAYAELRSATVVVAGGEIDGYALTARRGRIGPVLFDGRPPVGSGEIALGPSVLESLDLEIGDLVDVDGTDRRIVGEALTFSLADRSSVAGGALLDEVEAEFTTALVGFADGVDHEQAAASVLGDAEYGPPVRPADVTNLGGLRPLPGLLAAVLALIAVAALVHLAVSTGTATRRDLAVLSALGLDRRRRVIAVAAAVAAVSVTAAAVAIPFGLVLGLRSWSIVASTTDLATDARMPVWLLVAVPAFLGLVAVIGGLAAPHPRPALR